MPQCIHLYLDESGPRKPDRSKNDQKPKYDYFAMGGFLINEEDEDYAKRQHADFCGRWDIDYPLHSVEIRHTSDKFHWLSKLEKAEFNKFITDLHGTVCSVPMLGLGCVIHRDNYNDRYKEAYAHNRWKMCKTAFTITLERAARYALSKDRKLRVFMEACGKKENKLLKGYYKEMREQGMPFDTGKSSKYSPLDAATLKSTLYDLQYKTKKQSTLIHFADLLLYPIARGGFEKEYTAYEYLMRDKMLYDAHLDDAERPFLGTKYSCFDVTIAQLTVEEA